MTIVSTPNGHVHETIALTPTLTADVCAGLVSLAAFLLDRGYPIRQRARILDFVARQGTLAGCADLDHRHAITAETAFVDGMTAVSLNDPAWGSALGYESPDNMLDDTWNPNGLLRLDVAELVAADAAEFESWLESLDAAGFPMPFEAIV